MWMYLINQFHSGYFDNLRVGGKCCKLFICDGSISVFTAYLHSNRGDVSSFA